MRKIKLLSAIAVCISMPLYAEDIAWISDDLHASLVDKPEINGKFVGTVVAGEPVSIIKKSPNSDYLLIKTDTLQGWVRASNVITTPSRRIQFAEQEKKLNDIQQVNVTLSNNQQSNEAIIAELQKNLKAAQEEMQKTKAAYITLQRASGNVAAIDERNNELQNQVVKLEQENLALRHVNERLDQSNMQGQMLIGGALVIAGFLLHWLLGLMRVHRRRSSFDGL